MTFENTIWLELDEQGVTRDRYGTVVSVCTVDGLKKPNHVMIPKEAQSISGVSQAAAIKADLLPCPMCGRYTVHFKTDASVHVAMCFMHNNPYIWYRELH
jgi:hypothetical protein